MLHRLKTLLGCRVQCQDGDAGEIRDFGFDTVSWRIRNILLRINRDVGLCEVSLDTSDIDEIYPRQRRFLTRLTKQQVTSHATLTELIPTGQTQSAPHDFDYALAPMWEPYLSVPVSALMLPAGRLGDAQETYVQGYPIPYRHTLSEVRNWRVWTHKGYSGSLADLIIDTTTWAVTGVVARTRPWLFSKDVVLDTDTIVDITSRDKETNVCQDKTTAASVPAIWSNYFAR